MPDNPQQTPDLEPASWDDIVAHYARKEKVPVALAQAVMRVESAKNPEARSPKGAIGLMQLMPGTAAKHGVDPHDPIQNIKGGVMELRDMLNRFDTIEEALGGYNAGPAGNFNNPETRAYIPKVLALLPKEPMQEQAAAGEPTPSLPPMQPMAGEEPPSFWKQHPVAANVAKGTLDVLPMLGGVGGAIAGAAGMGAGPLGIATLPAGIALGAAGGRGARDLIAESIGLEEPTNAPVKALRMAGEGVFAAALPGAMTALRTPIQTTKEVFGTVVPPALKRYLPQLGKLFSTPRISQPILTRPPMSLSALEEQLLQRGGGTAAETSPIVQELLKREVAPLSAADVTKSFVRSPADWAAEDQMQRILAQKASARGMEYASGYRKGGK